MTLTTVFQVSLYALVSLAGTMLAYGETTFLPSGLTVLLSAFALVFNEHHARLRMNALVGNLLGLVALGAAGFEFFGDRADARLLAGSHFLVYITWIVLLQGKDIRQYWWLCALSLLQVALGSVLTDATGTYGLFLLAYLPLALWTLSVFTLYQGAYELGGLDHERSEGVSPVTECTGNAESVAGNSSRLTDVDPLILLRQRFAADCRSTVRHAIQQDSPGRWIVPRFVFGVLGLAVAGLALGLVLFLYVPRVSFGSGLKYQGESSRGRTLTGFSGEVRLGQIGQILENIDRVMRVKVYERVDGVNDKPISLDAFAAEFGLDAPLFRGSVLDQYRHGRWRGAQPDSMQAQPMQSHPLEPGLIRQEYTLELTGAEYLFAMRPISLARLYDPYGPINYAYDSAAFAGSIERRDPIEYLVYSKRRTPEERSSGKNRFGKLPGMQKPTSLAKTYYLQRPDMGIDGVIRLAQEVTSLERLIGNDDLSPERRKALTLEAHLRDSRQYSYSLNMEVADPQRDPVEEFLLVRKRGHCEYFASALALMLRAVSIPSRLVTGFKGADFHESDGYYEVQQRHAHVWVEAFVDGEWVVLDPTPGEREEAVRQVGANAGFWKNAKNSLSSLWSTYVVSLSLNRQQQALYDPLTGQVATGWTTIRELLRTLASGVGWVKFALSSPEQFLTPHGATIGLMAIVTTLLAIRLLRRGFRRSRQRVPATERPRWIRRCCDWIVARLTGRQPDPAHVVVAFYEQFLTLMDTFGFTRRNDQTQREFAGDVERALGHQLAAAGLAQFPTQLAELFYRVRFGDGVLLPSETTDLESRLGQLAVLLNRQPATG